MTPPIIAMLILFLTFSKLASPAHGTHQTPHGLPLPGSLAGLFTKGFYPFHFTDASLKVTVRAKVDPSLMPPFILVLIPHLGEP